MHGFFPAPAPGCSISRVVCEKWGIAFIPNWNGFQLFSEFAQPDVSHRSALEWMIDQYQVSTDSAGITNDLNRDDDPTYILRLIGQVITVSLETVKIFRGLRSLGLPKASATGATTLVS
jgi:hypothetical protein